MAEPKFSELPVDFRIWLLSKKPELKLPFPNEYPKLAEEGRYEDIYNLGFKTALESWVKGLSSGLIEFETELCELAFKYGTDKCPQITHSYTPFYYQMFAPKRQLVRKLLEIGVGGKEGGVAQPDRIDGASLFMWRDFFPKAKIYGIDIYKNLVFKEGQIETFLCNQSVPSELTELINNIGNDLDIVIDDGSHRRKDILISCKTLMPLLKKDATYIIEDTNSNQAQEIIQTLQEEYNCHIMRRSNMRTPNDRLIVITKRD